jgi:cytoskeletal protein CcmA (bactofilin family)
MPHSSGKMSSSVSLWAIVNQMGRCVVGHWQRYVPGAILARLPSGLSHNASEEFSMSLFRRRAAVPTAAGYSVIDDRLTISGEIHTDGTIRVDGRIEGSMHRADTLIVGADGTVVGDVEAREIVVGGVIRGNLSVTGRVEVQASATVQGDIRAAAVLLQEGGTVQGHMMIHPIESGVAPIQEGRRLMLTPSHAVAAIGQG